MSAPSTDAASRLLQLPDCLIGCIFEKLCDRADRRAFLHTCKTLHDNDECLQRVTRLTIHLDESKHGSVDHQLSTVPRGSAISKLIVCGYPVRERFDNDVHCMEHCFSPVVPPLLAAFSLERHKQLLSQVNSIVLNEMCGYNNAQSLMELWKCTCARCPKISTVYNFWGTRLVVVAEAISIGLIQAGVGRANDHLPARIVEQQAICNSPEMGATVYLTKLLMDDGLPWFAAKAKRDKLHEELIGRGEPLERVKKSGFYVCRKEWAAWKRPHILLAREILSDSESDDNDSNTDSDSDNTEYCVKRPYQNIYSIWNEDDLFKYYRLLSEDEEAEELWRWWYNKMYTDCLHGPNCVKRKHGMECYFGGRLYHRRVVHGALLPVLLDLLKVWADSRHNYNSDGTKRGLRAWCCNVLSPDEPQEALLKDQCHVEETSNITGDPSSSSVVASQPQTSLLVGYVIHEADAGALLARLGIQCGSDGQQEEGRGSPPTS